METTPRERHDFAAAAAALGWGARQMAGAVRGYLADQGGDPEAREGFGAWLWGGERCHRADLAHLGLEGWPGCECAAGHGCDNPAETRDDFGVPVCSDCEKGAVWSQDGDSDCRCCGDGDRVVWSGAAGYDGGYVYDDAPEEPSQDEDGEWAVLGMDGEEHGRFATRADAYARVERESILYYRGGVNGSRRNSYLPRSVCHVACGSPRRCGQWSTSWAVGCGHEGGGE